MKATRPERIDLAPGLDISRIVTGLWQVADLERDGRVLDPQAASDELADYVAAGFDTFDMADHYGSAELIVGALSRKQHAGKVAPFRAFTKWCPEPGEMRPELVHAAVERACERRRSSVSTSCNCIGGRMSIRPISMPCVPLRRSGIGA